MPDETPPASEHDLLKEITGPFEALPDDPLPIAADVEFPIVLPRNASLPRRILRRRELPQRVLSRGPTPTATSRQLTRTSPWLSSISVRQRSRAPAGGSRNRLAAGTRTTRSQAVVSPNHKPATS